VNVIVDTSVWSLALRRTPSELTLPTQKLTRLIQEGESIFLLGVILQELLQGLRSRKDFNHLLDKLSPFPIIEPRREDYVEAARLRNQCSAKGIQAGTIDFLIAAICIQYGCLLFTTDRDFDSIARHSALKLL
jgi:predicted nucleic acid-binding protein